MKSPLKDKPLRNPGDSARKALLDFLLDKVVFYYFLALGFGYVALVDWYRFLTEAPADPWQFTYLAGLTFLLALYKSYRAIPTIRSMKQGSDGERAVGQYLETLREGGAKVFHDLPAKGFNIDHVVIAAAGIFLIETKTYSKPDSGEPTITFDGEMLTLRGRGTFRDPVVQVLAGTRWLKDLLKASTGKDFPIRPVLVFPGWFVQPTAEARNSEVWVLNPKALPAFIANSKPCINEGDVSLIAFHLSRYVRTFEE